MVDRVDKYGLKVDSVLENFIESEALPGTGISSERFWEGFSKLIKDLSTKNKSLLEKREKLQIQINTANQQTIKETRAEQCNPRDFFQHMN